MINCLHALCNRCGNDDKVYPIYASLANAVTYEEQLARLKLGMFECETPRRLILPQKIIPVWLRGWLTWFLLHLLLTIFYSYRYRRPD